MLKSSSVLNRTKILTLPLNFFRAYRRPSTVQSSQRSPLRNSPRVINTSWSSPQDRIVRNAFSSDYVHAWTLLEACLDHGNMERAESVLMGLTEISSTADVTMAVNTYLQRLIEVQQGNPYAAIDWLRKLEYRIPKFQPNGVTDALMLKNVCVHSKTYPVLFNQEVGKYRKSELCSVLRQFELLGLDTIEKIMAAGGLEQSDLYSETQKLLLEAKDAREQVSDTVQENLLVESAFSNLDSSGVKPDPNPVGNIYKKENDEADGFNKAKLAAPIKKHGLENLTPTEAFGLVAIRHTLSGLQLRSPTDQKLIQELAAVAGLPHVKTGDGINFFEMYTQLKTDEERAKFDEILSQINEKRQKQVESRGIEASRMRWRQMFEQMAEIDKSGTAKVQIKGLETLLWQWNQAMLPQVEHEMTRMRLLLQYCKKDEIPKEVIKEHFSDITAKDLSDRFEFAPFLCLAKPENLPAMTMMELLRLNNNMRESSRSAAAMLSVGKNVEREYKLEVKKRTNMAKRKSKGQPKLADAVSSIHSWPTSIRAKIGSFLISLFLQTAKVVVTGVDPVSQKRVKGQAPAFHHSYQYQNGTKVGVLRPHMVVANYLSGQSGALQPQQLPMLCKPRPWTSWNNGGYYYTPSTIIRSKDCPEQVAYIAAASERGQLQKVFDGLNVLGETAWTVHKPILKVLSVIWNSKKEFLDIPPHVPSIPDLSDIPTPTRDTDPQDLRDFRRKCRARVLENGRLYSQRCDLNYKLDIARAMLGERFYMPHNLDFRGRAYPLSPHFNHLGNDISRALLIFWEGRKLGDKGLWWLKIHLANLFGVNKASHEERVAFVDKHIPELLNAASDPLGPRGKWWTVAESPFQALATCMEIKAALDCEDGPENFVSRLTVHQDGSCNGLQHYAALGGDFEGACEVNLQAADRPQDVYTRVCEIVKNKVANEDNSKLLDLAKLVYPILSRKVVKQTVMTNVYGVTYAGAREQVANRLRDLDTFPSDMVFKSATYIAQKVLDAVRELFTSAHEIQDWLGDNASNISRAVTIDPNLNGADSKFVSSVIWTTPLGLPIVQPYRVPKQKQVKTELQTIYISDPYSFQSVNPRKQKTAFPPNYIHSLDASHMLMSATRCSLNGIEFASVHDSYWTHASSVDIMNKALRECFVELHSNNLIDRLRMEFQTRYGNHLEVVEIPAECSLATQIKTLRSKFSQEKYGRSLKLDIPDQIEMELNEEEITPLKITKSLPAEELTQLISEASKGRVKSRYIDQKPHKSTEHEGTGLDLLSEHADIETDEVDELAEDEPIRTKNMKVIKILIPLRVPPVPARGDFDVKKVLVSPYFFS